jgi:hypothetical protein
MAVTVNGLTVHTQTGLGTWLDIAGGQGSADTTTSFFSSTSARGRKFSGTKGMMFQVSAVGIDLSNTVVQLRWQLNGGFADTRANGAGLIRVQDTSGNYSDFYVAGSDTYKGGWQISAVSTSVTPSAVSGTLDLAQVEYVGMSFNASGGSGGDPNCFIDQVLSFSDDGLTMSGTTTTLIKDFIDYDNTGLYGVFSERSGIIYSIASVINQGLAGYTSTGEYLVFEDYVYDDGTNVASALTKLNFISTNSNPKTFTRLTCIASNNSTKTGGNVVERSFVFNATTNLTLLDSTIIGFDFTTNGATNGVNLGDSNTAVTNTIFLGCDIIQNSGAFITNCNFEETTSTIAAFDWDFTTNNVEDCTFSNNANAIRIDSDLNEPYTFDGLIFQSNTFDVNNTSTRSITINLIQGSNASTFTGATTNFINSKQFNFTLNPAIIGYEWRIYNVTAIGSLSGAVEVAGQESATLSSQSYSYNYTADQPIGVQILSQPTEDYVELVRFFTLVNTDQNVTLNLEIDNNN